MALLAYAIAALLAGTAILLALALQFERDVRAWLEAHGGSATDPQHQIAVDTYDVTRTLHYEPYVVSHLGPFHSKTINVDANGVRATPGSVCTPGALRIFVYGGSTLWGYGVPDESTIPSHLQRELRAYTSRPFCVVNNGEWAWVSTQETMQFIRSLSRGDVPDAVIFYDGLNDVGAPTDPGNEVGAHDFLARYRNRLGGRRLEAVLRVLAEPITDALVTAGRRARGQTYDAPHSADSLALPEIATYARNYRIVETLTRQRHLPLMFFWQPNLFASRKPMSADETEFCLASPVSGRQLSMKAYALAGELGDSLPAFRDLQFVLDTVRANAYIDPAHLAAPMNQLVAHAMVTRLVADSAWRIALGIRGSWPVASRTAVSGEDPSSCNARTLAARP